VIERKRREGELDGFVWYCPTCQTQMHAEYLPLKDIVKDLPPVFERFYGDLDRSTCKKCGYREIKNKFKQP
jgi:3-hydroxyanthranilate 3,4-dioxygenase